MDYLLRRRDRKTSVIKGYSVITYLFVKTKKKIFLKVRYINKFLLYNVVFQNLEISKVRYSYNRGLTVIKKINL